jgi:hypothetical protein
MITVIPSGGAANAAPESKEPLQIEQRSTRPGILIPKTAGECLSGLLVLGRQWPFVCVIEPFVNDPCVTDLLVG